MSTLRMFSFAMLLVFSLWFFNDAAAQPRYTLDPGNTQSNTGPTRTMVNTIIIINNPTTDTLLLRWKFLDSDLVTLHPNYETAMGWTVAFCDNNVCHLVIPDSADFIPILPMDTGSTKLQARREAGNKSGQFRILLWEINGDSGMDTLTFNVTIDDGNSVVSLVRPYNAIRTFPNPVSELIYFDLREADLRGLMLRIYDSSGRELHQTNMQGNSADVSSLPSGVYLYSLFNEKGLVSTGKFFRE